MPKDSRPVFLNLLQIKFPVTAMISIGHRVSGLFMFLSLPAWLYTMTQALQSPESFARVAECFSYSSTKVFIFVSILATWYHVFAGVRHLIMDFGFYESLKAARITAFIVLVLTLISFCFLWAKLL